MIDLKKLRARASGEPDEDGAIGPTWLTPPEVIELLNRLEAAEKDAARWTIKKFAPEEVEIGNLGIRWVNKDGVHGRPTDHDVREFLLRTETSRGCTCEDCKKFYGTSLQS